MARFTEALKGIGMFLLVNVLFYSGWNIFNGLLGFSVSEGDTTTGYLGAFAWISFILIYICIGIIYPIYAIIINFDDEKETNFFAMIKGLVYWVAGTIGGIVIYRIADGILSVLTSDPIDAVVGTAEATSISTTTSLIGWLFVLTIYIIYFIILPLNQISKGFQGTPNG